MVERTSGAGDGAQAAGGGPWGDPVVAALDQAAAAHRARESEWRAHQTATDEALRELGDALVAGQAEWTAERERLDAELAQERAQADRHRHRAECLERALKDIHGALFSGDVYALILRACLTITEATRGVYVTTAAGRDRIRVRAAVGMDGVEIGDASPTVAALCRQVLEAGETLVSNDGRPAGVPTPRPAEKFRNFVAAPVVLMSDLHGVIIAGDRQNGDFDRQDVDSLLSVGDQAAVAVRNRRLERELQRAYLSTVSMLADAMEAKDPSTHGHCEMASRYARMVAERMQLPSHEMAVVCYAALLHDVGKIGVSDGVLNKPGPLLPEEVELVRAHVRVGHDLLITVPALGPVADVVLHHHEWYDGNGYPDGLRSEEIPLAARIVSAVDAYCAMMTRRSYKEAYTPEHARAELVRCSGTQFDPGVVEVLLEVIDDPRSADADDDFDAECGLLPSFVPLAESGELAGTGLR
jgi:HD-GYP domain-containing protein (c-di-GMP phosphodiesterase class II)